MAVQEGGEFLHVANCMAHFVALLTLILRHSFLSVHWGKRIVVVCSQNLLGVEAVPFFGGGGGGAPPTG